MTKKIYIAGPISGRIEEAEKEFNQAEVFLNAKGYEVVNPMKLPHDHNKLWSSYMRECIFALYECDTIYMLENYRQSPGAMIERRIAMDLDMEVIYKGS
jgi:nucleoside 2-deoxyribosyltransferase